MSDLTGRVKRESAARGFALCGVARAGPADHFDRLAEWLARGYAGEMAYLHEQADARRHPDSVLPGVRSVVMLAMPYGDGPPRPGPEPAARVARYAQGSDYHRVVWDHLNEMADWLEGESPGCRCRGVADTAPLLERDLARRAGLGWVGKNTMLLNPRVGSFFLLGALLTTLELEPDEPFAGSHCGTCTACLDACPTGAFPEPGWLDARECISYLTVELKTPIPERQRAGVGNWLLGCDVCQDVCPWNRKAPPGVGKLRPRPDLVALDPAELLGLTDAEFKRRFGDTALWRPRRRGIVRNAAVVLGNRGDPAALPALERALADREPMVREAAAWAIERIRAGGGRPPPVSWGGDKEPGG